MQPITKKRKTIDLKNIDDKGNKVVIMVEEEDRGQKYINTYCTWVGGVEPVFIDLSICIYGMFYSFLIAKFIKK